MNYELAIFLPVSRSLSLVSTSCTGLSNDCVRLQFLFDCQYVQVVAVRIGHGSNAIG